MTLTGCASISVQPGTAVATQQKPQKVYVEAFSTEKGEFNVDRDGAELAEFKTDLQKMMTAGITADLTKRLIPAVAAGPIDFTKRENAWLIRASSLRSIRGAVFCAGPSASARVVPSSRRAWRFTIYRRARRSRS